MKKFQLEFYSRKQSGPRLLPKIPGDELSQKRAQPSDLHNTGCPAEQEAGPRLSQEKPQSHKHQVGASAAPGGQDPDHNSRGHALGQPRSTQALPGPAGPRGRAGSGSRADVSPPDRKGKRGRGRPTAAPTRGGEGVTARQSPALPALPRGRSRQQQREKRRSDARFLRATGARPGSGEDTMSGRGPRSAAQGPPAAPQLWGEEAAARYPRGGGGDPEGSGAPPRRGCSRAGEPATYHGGGVGDGGNLVRTAPSQVSTGATGAPPPLYIERVSLRRARPAPRGTAAPAGPSPPRGRAGPGPALPCSACRPGRGLRLSRDTRSWWWGAAGDIAAARTPLGQTLGPAPGKQPRPREGGTEGSKGEAEVTGPPLPLFPKQ